jgi:hypothetical protein
VTESIAAGWFACDGDELRDKLKPTKITVDVVKRIEVQSALDGFP